MIPRRLVKSFVRQAAGPGPFICRTPNEALEIRGLQALMWVSVAGVGRWAGREPFRVQRLFRPPDEAAFCSFDG